MSPSIYQIMDFVFFHCSSFSFGAFLFTTLSCLVIKWNSGYSSIFSVILNNTIGMLMMSSIIFQHAVKFLLELSVGACRVTVCLSLSLNCWLFSGGVSSPAGFLSSRISLDHKIQAKPFFSECTTHLVLLMWSTYRNFETFSQM